MAVMQTPHGRVIGLIFPVEDRPKVEADEKVDGEVIETKINANVVKAPTAKKAGRTAKK